MFGDCTRRDSAWIGRVPRARPPMALPCWRRRISESSRCRRCCARSRSRLSRLRVSGCAGGLRSDAVVSAWWAARRVPSWPCSLRRRTRTCSVRWWPLPRAASHGSGSTSPAGWPTRRRGRVGPSETNRCRSCRLFRASGSSGPSEAYALPGLRPRRRTAVAARTGTAHAVRQRRHRGCPRRGA
jgi:hypothetical protein